MNPGALRARVTLETFLVVLVLALPAAWLGGGRWALGVLAGGALGAANFRWLAGRALDISAGGPAAGTWLVVAGLRWIIVTAIAGLLLASGIAHPVAIVAGLTALPCALIVRGLRAAREVTRSWK